jgi:hypothetical protein
MEIKWIKTKNQKTIYELVAPQVGSPTMVDQVGIKPYSWNDIIHMMLEMEYLYPLMPNPKTYYLLYRLLMNFRLGVVLLMFGAHIIEKQLLVMWQIKDLEWREYLTHYKAI